MTIEEERLSFRGVLCLHCKAPIPVPAIVSKLQAAESSGLEISPAKSQVFTLRCPACLKEKPYRTSEIMTFEGAPETAIFPARPASIRWYPPGGITKTAKA